MSTSTAITEIQPEDSIDTTSVEHRAMQSMMDMFKAVDYMDSNEFLDIASGLDCSPAFKEFAKKWHIVDPSAAAMLIIAGRIHAHLGEY